MNERLDTLTQTLFAAPRQLGARAIARTRTATRTTARMISKAKTPTHKMARAGLRVNKVAHQGFEDLVKQQLELLDGVIDESAQRLEMAAGARGLRMLVSDQVALFPSSRKRLVGDARKAFEILSDTGEDLAEIVKETVADMTGRKPRKRAAKKARKTARKKAGRAKKTAKKTAKKAQVRKKQVRKKTAARPKSSANKRVVRKTARTTAKKPSPARTAIGQALELVPAARNA